MLKFVFDFEVEFKRQIYFPEYSYGNQIKSDFKRSKFELGKVLISEFIPVNRPCNCNCSIPSFTGSFPGSDHILTFNSITFPGIFLGIDFSALEFEPLLVPSGFTSVPPVCVCALDLTLLDDGSTVTSTIGRLQKKRILNAFYYWIIWPCEIDFKSILQTYINVYELGGAGNIINHFLLIHFDSFALTL